MKPQDKVDFTALMIGYNEVIHGLGSTHTNADLLEYMAKFERFIDGMVNREVNDLVRPYLTAGVTYSQRVDQEREKKDSKVVPFKPIR